MRLTCPTKLANMKSVNWLYFPMKSFNATDAKNRFGDLLEASAAEPVLVTKNGNPIAYMVPADQFEKFARLQPLMAVTRAIAEQNENVLEVLKGFAMGKLPRRSVMRQLGLSWYGDLLEALCFARLSLPVVSKDQRKQMVKTFLDSVHG